MCVGILGAKLGICPVSTLFLAVLLVSCKPVLLSNCWLLDKFQTRNVHTLRNSYHISDATRTWSSAILGTKLVSDECTAYISSHNQRVGFQRAIFVCLSKIVIGERFWSLDEIGA